MSLLQPHLGAAAPDLGFAVYVHWPFCLAKCPYCDFNSHVRSQGVDEARFVEAFKREIAHRAALTPGRRAHSIFFGGGTPSLMSGSTVGAIIEAVNAAWPLEDGAEVTLEANPTSVEAARFRDYRAAGVNRISIGVQALKDADLKALGRMHSVAEARRAVALAQSLFDRTSFDLIYARPGQSLEDWRAELVEGLAMAGDHLSLYQLTIEEGTPFEKLHRAGKLIVPDEDLGRALFDATQEITEAAGMPAYEISNHARIGSESRHNLVYWRYGEYAGVGPGAHGRLVVGGERRAQATVKAPELWLERVERDGHGLVDDEVLTREEQGDEFLLMGLRLREGIDTARFAALSGHALNPERVADLKSYGFVSESVAGRLAVTPEGAPILNSVVADLAA